jgi:hypothetical protein
MLRKIGLLGLPLLLLATPASAVTHKQKMETCKAGATDLKLTGAKARSFIHKCMGRGDYEPAARREFMKKEKTAKKTAMKPQSAMKKPVSTKVKEPKPQ